MILKIFNGLLNLKKPKYGILREFHFVIKRAAVEQEIL